MGNPSLSTTCCWIVSPSENSSTAPGLSSSVCLLTSDSLRLICSRNRPHLLTPDASRTPARCRGGASVSADAPNLNEKAFEAVEKWRSRPLTCGYPYVFMDGIHLKRLWGGGSFENVAVMVVVSVDDDGHCEVTRCAPGARRSAARPRRGTPPRWRASGPRGRPR